MKWMAKWQEQEDGIVRNFSIILLAQRLVRKESVRRLVFIPQEAKRSALGLLPSVTSTSNEQISMSGYTI
jgi:hypothetical protein